MIPTTTTDVDVRGRFQFNLYPNRDRRPTMLTTTTAVKFKSIRGRFPCRFPFSLNHNRDRQITSNTQSPNCLNCLNRRKPMSIPVLPSLFHFVKSKSGFLALIMVVVFVFAVASMVMHGTITSDDFSQSNGPFRNVREFEFGSTFVPGVVSQRFLSRDGLDRLRSQPRTGVRAPRIALILGYMTKDPHSLLLVTVIQSLQKLGYNFEIFAVGNGNARSIWEKIGGGLSPLSTGQQSQVDWSNFEGIIVDSLEAKETISSLMQEPFGSVPLIWVIEVDSLSSRLPVYEQMGQHWRSAFSRSSVVIFPDFTYPMLYSELDTGNFYVIPGSPVDVWAAESYSKTHKKDQLRELGGFGKDDVVVLVVGSLVFSDELSWDYVIGMNSIGRLLTKYARRNDSDESFKFVFLCSNSTDGYDVALEEVASRLGLPHGSLRHYGLNSDANKVLLMSDIVLYGSARDVQGFPPLLIRAMTFEIPVIAPDFPVLRKYIVDGVHGVLYSKQNPEALMNVFPLLITSGKLSKFAQEIGSSGRQLAKNVLALDCIIGYARLLENVLNFPSDSSLPDPVSQIQQGAWEWNLFQNEIELDTGLPKMDSKFSNGKISVVHDVKKELDSLNYLTITANHDYHRRRNTILGQKMLIMGRGDGSPE